MWPSRFLYMALRILPNHKPPLRRPHASLALHPMANAFDWLECILLRLWMEDREVSGNVNGNYSPVQGQNLHLLLHPLLPVAPPTPDMLSSEGCPEWNTENGLLYFPSYSGYILSGEIPVC